MKYFFSIISLVLFCSCENRNTPPPLFEKVPDTFQQVEKTTVSPVIDGKPNDPAWKDAQWLPLDNLWQGEKSSNLVVHYKLRWTPDKLYVLMKIQNYQLQNIFGNPLKTFSSRDRVMVYLDENNSGGNHANNHTAFAYQVLPNGFVIDFNAEGNPKKYNHINSSVSNKGSETFWEMGITVFNESYCDNMPNEAVRLVPDKKLGFALSFVTTTSEGKPDITLGSVTIPKDYSGRIDIDSGLFGTLRLIE